MGEVGIVPEIQCRNCGRRTNTACADWDFRDKDKKANKCYWAFENGEWVKGCGFGEAPLMLQKVYWRKEWGPCPIKRVKK